MSDDSSKPRTSMAYNPPRLGLAGQTGTYQVVFKNGAIATLEKVALRQYFFGNKVSPYFQANFAGGGWQSVSFGSTGSGTLDSEQIAAIFRLDEDFNDSNNVQKPERAGHIEELALSVAMDDDQPALLKIRIDGDGGSLSLGGFDLDVLDLARMATGVGLVFGALLAETESRASLSLDTEGAALELVIVGAIVRYRIDAVAAQQFSEWIKGLEFESSTEQVVRLDEDSEEFALYHRALLEPIEATLDSEIEATRKRRRGYAAGERARLREIYLETIDYGEVVITGRHFFSAFLHRHSAMTIANKIIYPIKAWRADFSDTAEMPLLSHETCHVWQKQTIPRYSAMRSLLEHIRYGSRVYEYSIADHDRLTDYRFEQQGAIMQDWWGIRDNIFVPIEVRKRYEQVIRASIGTS